MKLLQPLFLRGFRDDDQILRLSNDIELREIGDPSYSIHNNNL